MNVGEVTDWLDALLCVDDFVRADRSLNGLQVGEMKAEVRKAAFSVDACLESFEGAAAAGADLLCVHHGLFWGNPLAVTGSHYRRIRFLIDHGLALYAAHLPLDAHPEVGNNAGLAERLGLAGCRPFGEYHGVMIGVQGELPEPLALTDVLRKAGLADEPGLSVLPFGPQPIRRVAIISGGAAEEVQEAIDEGIDLYITGESSHQVYHACLEAGISMAAGGHYLTETVGVQLLARRLTRETGIETCFIDVPTGL